MDTGVTQTVIDYSSQLTAIIDLLTKLNQGVSTLCTMFYFLLLVGCAILITLLFYRFLKIFI